MPHLHGTFVYPARFVAWQPEGPSSMPLLLDAGATTHVASSLWRTGLKLLPGVGISTRAVGGGVSASLGQGTPLIDFAEATGAPPTDPALFGTRRPRASLSATSHRFAPLPSNGRPRLIWARHLCKKTLSPAPTAHPPARHRGWA